MNLVGALTLGAVDQALAGALDGNDGGAVGVDVDGIPPRVAQKSSTDRVAMEQRSLQVVLGVTVTEGRSGRGAPDGVGAAGKLYQPCAMRRVSTDTHPAVLPHCRMHSPMLAPCWIPGT